MSQSKVCPNCSGRITASVRDMNTDQIKGKCENGHEWSENHLGHIVNNNWDYDCMCPDCGAKSFFTSTDNMDLSVIHKCAKGHIWRTNDAGDIIPTVAKPEAPKLGEITFVDQLPDTTGAIINCRKCGDQGVTACEGDSGEYEYKCPRGHSWTASDQGEVTRESWIITDECQGCKFSFPVTGVGLTCRRYPPVDKALSISVFNNGWCGEFIAS